uniref:DPBB_1 domain-containing protein n=1 Tax=Meloidogyne hapla TaxID=6305 RepID=A0A1I8AY47_MELHA
MRNDGNNLYRTPVNVRIEPGASYKEAGLIIKGNGMPTVCVNKTRICDSNNGDSTSIVKMSTRPQRYESTKETETVINYKSATEKISTADNKTTMKNNDNAPTSIIPSKVTTTQSSSGGDSLVVPTVITTKDTCLSLTNASGIIDSQLNKPIIGIFTFYDFTGRAACGGDLSAASSRGLGQPKMSAAVSGLLFDKSAKWVPSCFKDKRYFLNDKLCINKCVKIAYKGKTLTVPITDQCPECPVGHVDLSEDAFLWFEPKGIIVGVGRNAVITYITCPGFE